MLGLRYDYRRADTDTIYDVRHWFDARDGVWVLRELVLRIDGTLVWRHRYVVDASKPAHGARTLIQFSKDEQAASEAAAAARLELSLKTNLEHLAENGESSLSLQVSKAVIAWQRREDEEGLMLAEAKRRHISDTRVATLDLILESRLSSYMGGKIDVEPYRNEIGAQVQEMPYLRLLIAGSAGPRGIFGSNDGRTWRLETRRISDRDAEVAHRARISQGYGISPFNHWGNTKGQIRQILLPRANQLLQLASVRRMLDEALADGKRALVVGSYVFWYEPDGGLGWIVKQVGDPKGSGSEGDGEALWEAGTIVSKNHGRIVVLPFRKSDGEHVNGYTRNVGGDGPAKPRHKSQYVEIPFQRLERDLMIGLMGELPYE